MSNNNKEPIKIGIAGLGFGKSVHLPALKSNSLLEPVALWHPTNNDLEKICDENNLKAFRQWDQLTSDPDIDALIIATPPSIRYDLATRALNAGKHLLLEKPVALNFDQVNDLLKLAHAKRLSVAVDFEYRAVPLFNQLKRILDERLIGEIWLVKFDWLMSSRANPSRPWNWYSNDQEGGGVIGALGTHAIDILHWLFGQTESVISTLSTSIKERTCNKTNKQKRVSSEDICLGQLEIKDTFTNNLIPAQLTLSSVSKEGRGCWIEVYGSEGTLILGSDNQKDYVHGFGLWHAEKGLPIRNISADSDLAFKTTWKDGRIAPVSRIQHLWAESICDGTPIIPGLLEGAASQKVCDKLKESAKSGVKLFLSKSPETQNRTRL